MGYLLLKKITLFILVNIPLLCAAQEVSLHRQFNGHYDYVAFGNTLNARENGANTQCQIFTQSAADFQLTSGQNLVAAYLYWAGSGLGDFDVTLQGFQVNSERNFFLEFSRKPYFAAFADVTSIIQNIGNARYTLSDLNLTEAIIPYCSDNGGSGTNFGGWAVYVIFEDLSLPRNQLSIYDGLQNVSRENFEIVINLENLNVQEVSGAKIGFLAWEGDSSLAVNETLQINNNILNDLPLNPSDNAFNSTNSYTNSNLLYNMDMDFYTIENYINTGDTSATIKLTSGQDFVILNTIITVLNSELPDATIAFEIPLNDFECGQKTIRLAYTVYNINCTAPLPASTPIAFFANNTLIGQSATIASIEIDGSENGTILVTIPESIPQNFILTAAVDDSGNNQGIVNEINEDNNTFEVALHLKIFPKLRYIQNLENCDVVGIESFNLLDAVATFDVEDTISFYLTEEDAENDTHAIIDLQNFMNTTNPQIIYVRVSNEDCFITDYFTVNIILCALPDATVTIISNLNACRRRDLLVGYSVFNSGTLALPEQTPIAFYIDNTLVSLSQTQNSIAIAGSESSRTLITLNESIPDIFNLKIVVDDLGNGVGIVEELDETNNVFESQVTFSMIPPISVIPDIKVCDEGNDMATFNLRIQDDPVSNDENDIITYYTTFEDAILNTNEIPDPEQFQNTSDPQTIYVRLENEICFATTSFSINTQNCAPFIPDGFSPNADGINDAFEISNLLDIYPNFQLLIYTRQGNLIYDGTNESGFWKGIPNTGLLYNEIIVPVGTYYYVLHLNNEEYPNPFIGYVYINY